jgi:PAS domain S-box-containing protein
MDWSTTPIGPVDAWSPTLRTMVRLILSNRLAMLLWWGPQFCQLYNDAFRRALGAKHPRSMGQPASECWPEIWGVIGPKIETPFRRGSATWTDDLLLEANRGGLNQETHWAIVYSPVPDDSASSGIGGVIGTANDITDKVVSQRRLQMLRNLAARSAEASTPEQACAVAAQTLAQQPEDAPFSLLYLLSDDLAQARLAGASGLTMGLPDSPIEVDLAAESSREQPWPLAQAARSKQLHAIEHLQRKLVHVPAGPWADPPRSAVVCPIASNLPHRLAGLLVLGVSSRLVFDDHYRGFCDLVCGQIAASIARACEQQRERAQAPAARSHEELAGELIERRHTEEALRASEERFRRYFDLGLIGMAITSPSKGCLEVNDELCRVLGYERSELLQMTWAQITHPDDLDADVAQFGRVLAGEIDGYRLDKRWIRKDGRIIDSIMAAQCVRRADGSVDYFVGLVLDTTERKRAEKSLGESEKRFRLLVESIPHHVWSVRPGGSLAYWNQRLADYVDVAPEALRDGTWAAIYPDDTELVKAAWQQAWMLGTGYEMEQRIRGRDGLYRRFVSRGVPIQDEQGRPVEWFGTDTDVEEHRQAEEALHKTRSELAHVSRVMTMGELAASISHEVNQPLAAIVANAGACARWLAAEPPNHGEAQDAVARVIRDANRATNVVAGIRAFLKREESLVPLSINDVIREVVALTQRELAAHRVSLGVDLAHALPRVKADRIQLQQVMLNLVMNALEAMEPVTAQPRFLNIRTARGNARTVIISVCDSGVGLDPEQRDRIFDAFHTTKPLGMGMGLAISRSIVEAHGGRLWASANPDCGETFYFTVPYAVSITSRVRDEYYDV